MLILLLKLNANYSVQKIASTILMKSITTVNHLRRIIKPIIRILMSCQSALFKRIYRELLSSCKSTVLQAISASLTHRQQMMSRVYSVVFLIMILQINKLLKLRVMNSVAKNAFLKNQLAIFKALLT